MRFFARRTALAFLALSFVSMGLVGLVPARADQPMLVIHDNDFVGPGGPDIQPAVMLLGNPAVRVLGFTVVSGDGWEPEETAHLLRFLEIAKRTDIPVVQGAVFPLVNSVERMRAWEQAYGKIPWKGAWNDPKPGENFHPDDPYLVPDNPSGNPTTKPAPGTAAEFLIQQVREHPHQVTILESGPLTNLALAIRLDPEFASLAKELVFMGGLVGNNPLQVTGDADFYSDFNILFDPEAAHIVLTAPWAKIVSVGNVTNQTMMTPELTQRMAAVKTPVTEFLAKYAQKLPMWDELTAAVTVDPSLVTKTVDAYMDIDLEHGMHYGQAHVWPEATRPHQGERKVTIVESVDFDRFYDAFVKAAQFPVKGK
ncbi:nucleoside hydrolase [Aliidongia dinghuensis]|uniref:Nucleoside hydrolase n=1 Tax=Aliidongia dinghuensis TaxID=1867774 RepID=A0A8J2YQK8_9PROT|nr:nucleoside hydrolase [Aliidongia dinghuensis]GGF05977.1 nucleoside hydrolase [Aliidongia dinghuensis]